MRGRGVTFYECVAGKLVEEEEGIFGVWASYIVTGVGANLLSWLLLPSDCVSIGASGSVFGLFVVAALVKVRCDVRVRWHPPIGWCHLCIQIGCSIYGVRVVGQGG